MPASGALNEAELLKVAIDLLERSDRCSTTQSFLARHYARQAYQLAVHSERLRRLITEERVQMIVRRVRSRRINQAKKNVMQLVGSVRKAATGRVPTKLSRVKVAFALLITLLSTISVSTPTNERVPEQKIFVEAKFASAPL